MTERFSTKKLVLSALFAALACVATMSIRIPTPGTGGYIHPGDAIVILCGVFLDPVSAFLAVASAPAWRICWEVILSMSPSLLSLRDWWHSPQAMSAAG